MKDEREKEYKLLELEKIIDESKYYLSTKEKTREFVERSSGLLNDLKKHPLAKEEKKKVSKVSGWLKKIRYERLIR